MTNLLPVVKQRVYAAIGLSGVVGGSARGQISQGTWEAPRGWVRRRAQRGTERHNRWRGPGGESERPIRAKKRGNARGAKGPY
jgi:hypothetical protein